jgi:hypothetical protein
VAELASARPDPVARGATVTVVGGGLAGVAAALAAVRCGASVTLLASSGTLGGQLTSQGVTPLDEHALIETSGATATYRALRDGIRARYRATAPSDAPDTVWRNPGNGWVSRLCAEPAVAEATLEAFVAEAEATGRLDVRRGTRVVGVGRDGPRIVHLDVETPDGAARLLVDVVVEAMERGDLLPLAGAPWVSGAEARSDTGETLAPDEAVPTRTQAITVPIALRRDPAPGPVVPRPSDYERWRRSQPFSLDVPDADGNPRRFGVFEPVPGGPPPFWTYRRIRDSAALGGNELALVNWPSNDHLDADLLSAEDPDAVVDAARRLTLAFVHWLQTEAPRDEGGRGVPELQPDAEVFGTHDGLAPEPYIREARRLRARSRIVAEDILPDEARGARGRARTDSGGIAWYPMDVHASVGHPGSRNDPTVPFQLPLSALVAAEPVNLVAAGKTIGATHLSNGATRVHPAEWASGEAAGVLAARSLATSVAPSRLVSDPAGVLDVQVALLRGGAPLAWTTDVAVDDPRHDGVQLLAVAGALEAPGLRDDLEVHPDRRLDDEDRELALACLARLAAAAGRPRPATTSARTLGDLALLALDLTDDLPTVTDTDLRTGTR